ncbi:hypothetical protein At12D13_31950 [Agrobacterium fabrum]|nr:hypothetical protein At12D13_31950 [Agrobacterium fabrum]
MAEGASWPRVATLAPLTRCRNLLPGREKAQGAPS